MPVDAMQTNLTAVEEALEGLTDVELHALRIASSEMPQTAPRVLAWIEDACDWELNRRHGFDYPLPPPKAAIDPREDEASVNAVQVMRESFAGGAFEPAALRFFDAVLELLAGRGLRLR